MRVSPRLRNWLIGPRSDPSVRVRYWTEVEGRGPNDREVERARRLIGRTGWAASLLASQFPDGHWSTPGVTPLEMMRPRFTSTHWIATVLAELGATRADPRIENTAELLLAWRRKVLRAKDAELCITGNAARTLIRFGYVDHPVVQASIDWLVRSQRSDGGWTCFHASRSGTLDGWEGLAALAAIPVERRSPGTHRALERGAEFYLRRHLRDARGKPYAPWFRIHYPNHFYYDVLLGLRLLTQLGFGSDRRLGPAVDWLRSKRRKDGTWALDGVHPVSDLEDGPYIFRQPVFPLLLEQPNAPSRWATVEALGVLSKVEGR